MGIITLREVLYKTHKHTHEYTHTRIARMYVKLSSTLLLFYVSQKTFCLLFPTRNQQHTIFFLSYFLLSFCILLSLVKYILLLFFLLLIMKTFKENVLFMFYYYLLLFFFGFVVALGYNRYVIVFVLYPQRFFLQFVFLSPRTRKEWSRICGKQYLIAGKNQQQQQ